MYREVNFSQKDIWDEIVNSFNNVDIYFRWGYIKPFSDNRDGEPILFYYEDDNGRVANIFLKRDIADCRYFKNIIDKEKYFDITSPYGYGGVLHEGTNEKLLAKAYVEEFERYCADNNIISEFIRFNPMINNYKFLDEYYDITFNRKTVYMKIDESEEKILSDMDGKCRGRVRKAIKNGVIVKNGNTDDMICKFSDLYLGTMDRDNAEEYYYFNKEFFFEVINELKDNSKIFTANIDERVISAALVLFNENYVHCHFLGNDKEYLKLAPNNLLFFEIAKWGHENGKSIFHIGGGYQSENDNLFKFKSTFSKSNRFDFYIGKKIYNKQMYDYLVNIRGNNYSDSKFFPKYREKDNALILNN